ncbi:MAG: right-handed parallel beta-helix repeat-containing protein [Verrucomicrobiota bacterium]|nr:right-handed parallel beta-helix repeat-containing protein [Verrucomicrobiota bacterium]
MAGDFMKTFQDMILAGFCICLPINATTAEKTVSPGQDYVAILKQLAPGDVLRVKPGVYEEGWVISGLRGTVEKTIIISGQEASNKSNNAVIERMPIFRPKSGRDGVLFCGEPSEYIIIEGLRFEGAERAGLIVNGSRHITIRDCHFVSNGWWGVQTRLSDYITVEKCLLEWSKIQHGIYFSTTDHPAARNNHIRYNNACGIHMNGDKNEGGDGMITGGLVESNSICFNGRNGGAAINMDGVERTIVRGNVIENNLAGGIVSFSQDGRESGSSNEFYRNVLKFRDREGRYGIKITGSPLGIRIHKNVFVCTGCPAVDCEDGSVSGISCDRNAFSVRTGDVFFKVDGTRVNLEDWRRLSGQGKGSK